MSAAFHVRHLRMTVRVATMGVAAFLLVPAAGAAPARPDAVLAPLAPIEMAAAKKAHRAKAARATTAKHKRRGRRSHETVTVIRGGAPAGADAVVVAAPRYRAVDDAGPVYAQYPYAYGDYGYGYDGPGGYDGGPRRRRHGEAYDRRYWRGGGPGEGRPSRGYAGDAGVDLRPGPRRGYSGEGPTVIRPRPGRNYAGDAGGGRARPEFQNDYQQPRAYRRDGGHGGGRRPSGDAGGYTFSPQSGWMGGPPIMQMAPAPVYRGPIQPGGVPLDQGGNPVTAPPRFFPPPK